MNHWESIVNIALCRYKLVSSHKYRHIYKSKQKEFIPAFLVASLPLIFVITALSLARSNVGKYHPRLELNSATKQTKERKEIFLGFLKVNRKQEKGEIFMVFLQIRKNKEEQAKISKRSKRTKQKIQWKGEENTYSPKLRPLA